MGAAVLDKLESYESAKFKEFNQNVLDEHSEVVTDDM